MIVDQDRIDLWLTKGLGGAIDMIEHRSRMDRFIHECFYNDLKEVITTLENLSKLPPEDGPEEPDQTLFAATSYLLNLFLMRIKKFGLRSVKGDIRKSMMAYVDKLKESLQRLEPKV